VRALVDILRADAEDNAVADTAGAEVGAESSTEEAASSQQVESLRALVRQAQHAGLPVTLETDLDGELPAAAARVLYRVMQESLTNVLRHAPGRDATVSLRTGNGRALLVIENAPNLKASSTQVVKALDAADADRKDSSRRRGFGLLGMRDRVTDLDGSFSAGPTTEGGWRVTAELPIAG
jgi:integral membrane sensor signal transduction histidine kinase